TNSHSIQSRFPLFSVCNPRLASAHSGRLPHGRWHGLSTTIMQTFSITSAAVSDCRECARLLVEQLGEHGVDAPAEQLARVLERVVTDGARGFILLARDDRRIVGIAYIAMILSAE